MCYLMTTFWCPSDVLITSWLFTAWWSTWPGNHLVVELVGSCIPIHARFLEHKKEVDTFTAGTQTRASRARESSVTHKSSHHRPCRGREPCHRLGQGKSGQQRSTATDQMDKRGTLEQEDTDVHESGTAQPHMVPGDFQVTCSNQDVIKMSDGHRNVVIR